MRRYNDSTIMTAELKSTPVGFTAALGRELSLRPIGRTMYWMSPCCLSGDEMTRLAARTLDIVSCV
jgi:adenosylmethionine-8-amino-7-oxononanoate aminotransferase